MLEKNFNLSTLKNGGLEEVFQRELNIVLDNIADINTSPEAKRNIKIDIELRPDSERESLILSFSVKSKLAPFQKQAVGIFIGKENGGNIAIEHQKGVIKNQIGLNETEETKENVKKEQKIISIK